MNAGIKKSFWSTFWLSAESAFRILLGVVVISRFSNYLGPVNLGIYNHGYVVVSLLLPIYTLGINSLVVRELINKTFKQSEILGSVFSLRIFTAVIALIMAVVYGLSIGRSDILILGIIFTSSYFVRAFGVIDLWVQSRTESSSLARYRTLAFIISAAFIILGTYLQVSIYYFAVIYTIEFALQSAFYIYSYRKSGHELRKWRVNFALMKKFLKNATFLFLSALAVAIYMKVDQIMIANMIDEFNLGIYASVVKIAELWNFIPMAIMTSLFPSIVLIKAKEKYQDRLQVMYDVMLWGSIALATVVSLLSPYVINFLYEPEYQAAIPVLKVHIWSIVAIFLGNASTRQLVAEGAEETSFYRTLLGALVNIALNLYLIPKYGILGAAYTTVISYMVAGYLANGLFKKSRQSFIAITKSLNIFGAIKRVWAYVKVVL
jgi:O-antigen/teichoic acid export membrane protein